MNTYDSPVDKRSLKDRLSFPSFRGKRKRTSPDFPSSTTNGFRIPLQRFLIRPHEEQTIAGKLGTRIVFPANAFFYSSGVPVFEEVEIELKEVMTKGDAVRENLTTTSGTDLLESGGMIYLNASSNGENVYLSPDGPARIEMPRSQNDYLAGMDIFTGQRQVNNGIMDWRRTNTLLRARARNRSALMRRLTERRIASGKATSADVFNAFMFETTQLGWINCDRFLDVDKDKIKRLQIIPNVPDPVEVKVVLKEYNSVLPVQGFGEDYRTRVPSGTKATVTGYASIENQHFFGMRELLTGEHPTVQLSLAPYAVEDIKKQLRKL